MKTFFIQINKNLYYYYYYLKQNNKIKFKLAYKL